MSNFDYSARAVDKNRTQKFCFHDLEGKPVLEVKTASRHNKSYHKMLTEAGPRLRRLAVAGDPNAETEARSVMAEIFSETVVVDWPTCPLNSKGKKVEFSTNSCREFLEAIPDYMFSDPSGQYLSFVQFVQNQLNFVDAEGIPLSGNEPDEDDVKDMAKN